jgi:hypothetical protein
VGILHMSIDRYFIDIAKIIIEKRIWNKLAVDNAGGFMIR